MAGWRAARHRRVTKTGTMGEGILVRLAGCLTMPGELGAGSMKVLGKPQGHGRTYPQSRGTGSRQGKRSLRQPSSSRGFTAPLLSALPASHGPPESCRPHPGFATHLRLPDVVSAAGHDAWASGARETAEGLGGLPPTRMPGILPPTHV